MTSASLIKSCEAIFHFPREVRGKMAKKSAKNKLIKPKKPASVQAGLFDKPAKATTPARVVKSKPAQKQKVDAAPPAQKPQAVEPPVNQPPVKKPKHRSVETAESMSKRQRDISISEFFTKNRHLLGFDNPRRALLTTIKEAVDNSLDACEEADILPDIYVEVTPIVNQLDRFTVRVRDNGPGIVKKQIPNVFGKLLYGSKFHRLKMARGQQGIGISAAGMYGQLTTGRPVRITSRVAANKPAHYYEITIDTQKNEPRIEKDTEVADWPCEHGTQVEIDLEAKYQKGRQSIDEYIEQTVIANPHVAITYVTPEGEKLSYERAASELPSEAREIKPHPYGLELGMLIKMLHDTSSRSVKGCLQADFSRVSARIADEILEKAKIEANARPSRIAREEADRLLASIQDTKIMNPPTDCLSPIGEELILRGLKRIDAEFYTAVTRTPSVYRGNPFLVEIGVAYGGSQPRDSQVRVLRYANRVPLLYQPGACAISEAIADTSWKSYGLAQSNGALPVGPAVILVHVASVWVPFTSESKEAIADYDEIRQEVRLALQECGRKLSAYLNRRRRQKYQGERRGIFERYIGEVVEACATIKRINRDQLRRNLLVLANETTARADELLDEHGRPIKKKRAAAPETEFGTNTLVVDRDAEPAGELFQQAS